MKPSPKDQDSALRGALNPKLSSKERKIVIRDLKGVHKAVTEKKTVSSPVVFEKSL